MRLIAIDMEFNQPSQKIIELGYVIFEPKTEKMVLQKSIIVNSFELVNPEITQLTSITQKEVDGAMDIFDAYDQMCHDMERLGVSNTVVEWGSDHLGLREQMKIEWKDFCFQRRAIDAKSIYTTWSFTQPNKKQRTGLKGALESLGMEFEGTQHRAMDDAYNTVRIYLKLIDKFRNADKLEKLVKELK